MFETSDELKRVFDAAAAGDLGVLDHEIDLLADALAGLERDERPVAWARTQFALALTLKAKAELADDERLFEQAVTAFERANLILREVPAASADTTLRGLLANARAVCLARQAALTGDVGLVDTAEAAIKIELTALDPRHDPLDWALAQLQLARLYEARGDILGEAGAGLDRALFALDMAIEVFSEEGCHGLSVLAEDAFARLTRRVAERA
jgi:tetratricopeptide (TPR) repeat protein